MKRQDVKYMVMGEITEKSSGKKTSPIFYRQAFATLGITDRPSQASLYITREAARIALREARNYASLMDRQIVEWLIVKADFNTLMLRIVK